MAKYNLVPYSLSCVYYESHVPEGKNMKSFHNVIEPLFESEEYVEYMETFSMLKRISFGYSPWAGDGVPNDAHFWGKQDFLADAQFQGEHEVNYFRKTNTDLVTFIQTEGWLCLVRIRKILRLLNELDSYDEAIAALSKNAGFPLDTWGTLFEKLHPERCQCSPCYALRDVRKQLKKKKVSGEEITTSVIHHIRRCVYRVLTAGIDRIFETFCSRRFSVVWFILLEEFDEHYQDVEFEKLCSLIINDIVAIEPLTSIGNFSKTLTELYEGATDLASAVLHKFAVILGSPKLFYTTSMNFIMFYIDSFNMIIRMLRWLENKFTVFNQLANEISDPKYEDKFDFKTLILHAMSVLVYSVPDVVNRRDASMDVIMAYQKIQKSYFGPNAESLEKYLDYIDNTLLAANAVFQMANLPCKCPTFKVPSNNLMDAALYINPYRVDQFDTPQVFHCYWNDRFIIERSHSPWKLLYNSKTKILLRLTIENPSDKNKKLAVNIFAAEESPSKNDRLKDQYFAMYESRLDRLVDIFEVLRQEVLEYYASTDLNFKNSVTPTIRKRRCTKFTSSQNTATGNSQSRSTPNSSKISVTTKLKRPDKGSREFKNYRMSILATLMEKHRKIQKPSTIESLEQLLTFAVKTGVEGSGMLSELSGESKNIYVSITCIDRERRSKAVQEFSLHELMSFIIFWYAKHGCLTEFEGHSMHRRKYDCGKSGIRDGPSCKSAEDSQAEAILHESELTLLSEEDLKRCKKETTMFMNEMAQSKRAFAKLASTGFYVTQRGEIVFAEGTSVMTSETDVKRADITHKKCKTTVTTTVPEIRTRMRKAFEERHTEVVINSKITSHVCKVQKEKVATTAPKPQVVEKLPVEQDVAVQKDSLGSKDVDEIVKLIEGTHIKSNDPKKAAKKARQKEKKELERQKQAEDKAKEEEMERAEERRRLEEERKKEEDEKRKREDEERRRKEELQRKQREAADQKKEEQRKKREEIERRKAEEKKQKKEAKKLRREQRKMDVDTMDVTESKTVQVTIEPESRKTELTKPTRGDSDHQPVEVALEKEYGRIKHEKEQRKREEEETRRLEQLQAQERAQANKKNKKKKKKQKHASENQNTDDLSIQSGCTDNHGIKVSTAGQPLLELLTNAKCKETQGKGSEEKSNLVTIKKHMDSSVTISMKGKEGESDLVYTLMNGQVYPTSVDGRIRSEEAVPLQHTAFVKHEPPPPPAPVNHTVRVANAEPMSFANPVKPIGYSGASHMAQDNTSLTEIDLSQLKLPPGITITKVPQHLSGQRSENAIEVPMADPHARLAQSPMTDFHRSRSLSGMENRYNSNVMVVDSRCSSLESPVIGIRPSEMMYGANGTRASSEASIASDRPSSGLDSMCNNNGTSPFITRPGYPSSETLSSRIPMPISSPFATTSRNETPSPAWQHEMNPGMTGLPGMIPNNVVRSDRQGFWSSTPASPVAFPPSNSVHESVIKAQDQQFSWPNMRPHGASYPNVGKRPQTNDGIPPNRKSADFKLAGCAATNVPSYSGAQRAVNGSPDHPAPGTIGYLPGFDSNASKHVDEWNPWQNNVERQSPELRSTRVCASSPYMGYMRSNSRDGDIFGNWTPQPCPEKPALNRGVNPYGPIGSNISRRPSNSGGNDFGQNGKMTASSGIGDGSCWSYNRTF